MPTRIQFYNGVWTDPPPTEDIYTVPQNPVNFDPVDESYVSWNGGLNVGNRYECYYDNRERSFEWKNIPAYAHFNTMIHTFEDYQYSSELYINLGNSIAPGLYSTGNDWHKIKVTGIYTKIGNGTTTIFSGGITYNKYVKITLNFEDLGAV